MRRLYIWSDSQLIFTKIPGGRSIDAIGSTIGGMQLSRFLIAYAVALIPLAASAGQPRSLKVKHEFQRLRPCPSTGQPTGRCSGYVKDHIIPLACGGPDAPSNMQWQTTAAAKAKDKWERRGCRR
jgi:hypothetical protein